MKISWKLRPRDRAVILIPVLVVDWEDGFMIAAGWLMWSVGFEFGRKP